MRQLIGTSEGGAAHETSSTLMKRAGTEMASSVISAARDCSGGWKTHASAAVGAMLPPRTVTLAAVVSAMYRGEREASVGGDVAS